MSTHGPLFHDNGDVTFRLWAPDAKQVSLRLQGKTYPMQGKDGWYSLTLPATSGDRYQFVIGEHSVPDPASRFQPEGVHGPSELVAPGYEWQARTWRGRPWEEAVIYELHTGTFSPEGNFSAIEERLDYLADLGVTALEIMPVAAFDGVRGWGYDGVLPYAPHAAYGDPHALKQLVDAAHKRGLMVLLDVVYNHFGPSGNYLSLYATSFFTDRHRTPWGAAIDFRQRPVRDFFIENALYWMEEFRFDGLRFDAVHAILDDSNEHILTEIARRVRAAMTDRPVHLILENDKNEARHLGQPYYDAQWNDDVHHVFHVLVTGETGGYYSDYADDPLARLGTCLTQGFDYQGQPSAHHGGEPRGEPTTGLPLTAFVNFTQNHDQIGNRAFGDRLATLAPAPMLSLLRATLLLSPSIPLLYMGEEWGSTTPFLYFCDFGGELADLVREGRRKEFASFPEFADPAMRERIPDPNAPEAFALSRLAWDDLVRVPHATAHGETRHLLTLRHQHLVPLLSLGLIRAAFHRTGEHGLDLHWHSTNGQVWHMRLNIGKTPLAFDEPMAGSVLYGEMGIILPPHGISVALGVGDG